MKLQHVSTLILLIITVITGGLLLATSVVLPGQYRVMSVMSGSMEPALNTGGLIITAAKDSYSVDDVISFKEGRATSFTTHRIVEIAESGEYVTQGDANEDADPETVDKSSVAGKVLFHIPFLGYLADFVKTPLGFFIIVLMPAAYIIFSEIQSITNEVKKMRGKKASIVLLVVASGLSSLSSTNAYFTDTEMASDNTFVVSSWDSWVMSTQEEFDAGEFIHTENVTSPGDVQLVGAHMPDADDGGLWHLNETSGTTATDSSLNVNNGTVYGATWTIGKFGNALEFDGVDDYVSIPDTPSLDITSNITVEAWIYSHTWDNPDAAYNVLNILDKGEHKTAAGYDFYVFNGLLAFRINKSCSVFDTAPPLNQWHHVAATYDGSTMKLFINAVEVASSSCSQTILTNNEPLYIGNGVDREYQFDGLIDEVRISNTVKSDFFLDYSPVGFYRSPSFDAGAPVEWWKLEWTETTPAHNPLDEDLFVNLTVKTSADAITWTDIGTFSSSPIDLSTVPSTQYIRWQANFVSSEEARTALIHDVSVIYFEP